MRSELVVRIRRSVRGVGGILQLPSKSWILLYVVRPLLFSHLVMVLMIDTFGYKHLLWVYSGRRGIHCWISDPAALDLNDEQRRALVTFMEVIKGSKEQMKKVNVRGPKGDSDLHPYLEYVPVPNYKQR
jgi:hypothetical protein